MTKNVDRVLRLRNKLDGMAIMGCFAYPHGLSVVVAPRDGTSPLKIIDLGYSDMSDCLIDKLGIAVTVDGAMLADLKRHQDGIV